MVGGEGNAPGRQSGATVRGDEDVVSRTAGRRGLAVEPSTYAADMHTFGASNATPVASTEAGIDPDALAARLQSGGAKRLVDSSNDLMAHIDEQSAALRV
jgi:hypothetical protein